MVKDLYCLNCQKNFSRQLSPSNIKKGKGKYCSRKCCIKHFYILRDCGNIELNIDGLILGRCRKGSQSNLWKGGISKFNRSKRLIFMDTLEYKKWRRNIFKRDNHTCQICGKRGGNLRGNHIKKYSDYPELRTQINNGIVICRDCDLLWVLNREKEWESYFK